MNHNRNIFNSYPSSTQWINLDLRIIKNNFIDIMKNVIIELKSGFGVYA